MGETDVETMANVTIAKYDFDDEAFNDVSAEAKDFISKLLVKQISWVISDVRQRYLKTAGNKQANKTINKCASGKKLQ